MRFQIGQIDAQRGHVGAIGFSEFASDGADRYVLIDGCLVDLVVDVGDVAGIYQRRIMPAQQSCEHTEYHRAAGIADMHVVVDGRSTDIHADAILMLGFEALDAAA